MSAQDSRGGASTGDASCLSLDKILAAARDLPPPLFPELQPLSLFGMRVLEIPPDIRPVLRILDDVPCRDDVRREVNAWLLEMFGTRDHSPFARGQALLWSGHMAIRKEDAVLLTNIT